jgi:hypothetical protein
MADLGFNRLGKDAIVSRAVMCGSCKRRLLDVGETLREACREVVALMMPTLLSAVLQGRNFSLISRHVHAKIWLFTGSSQEAA